MDIKEYISSGIIESYILDVTTDQERREVECMSKIYPEIQSELMAVQEQFMHLSQTWAKEPPASLRGKVLATIANTPQDEEGDAPIIQMSTESASSEGSGTWKWAAAACAIGVALLSGLLIRNNSTMEDQASQLTAYENKINEQGSALLAVQEELNKYADQKSFLLDPATTTIALQGTAVSPQSGMRIHWNKDQQKMIMSSLELPQPNKELQYQLWAIVDGAPVDLGVFDLPENDDLLVRETSVSNVQAFAVTLETAGGNPSPNLEQLYVIGSLTE